MPKLKVKTPAQMKAEMAVGRARGVAPVAPMEQTGEFRPTQAGDTVGGYLVREDIPNTSSIGASLENYKTLGLREVPMNAFSVQGKPEYYSKSNREYTQNLAEQINQNKELNPLIVVKDKEGYYVLEGGHRFDALRELDAQSFPALVVEDLDGMAHGGAVHMQDGGTVKPPPIFEQAQVPFEEVRRELGMKDGGDAGSGIDINRLYSPFSVLEKPSYGSEIPGTPTIDQQRYELTLKGQQEAENRARRNMDSLSSVDPAGTLGVSDVLTTLGKGIVAAPAYIAGNIYDWLRNNKVSDEGAKARGQAIEEWMQPKTQEGAEFLETLGEIPEKITGATMGFGLHPNLWVTGAGMPTPAQMRAGLRLGAERAAPIAGKIDQAVRSGYESGAIPQPGMSIKDVTPRVLAPANEQGFYSPTEAAALNLQRKSGSGQAFLNDLLKQENVRPDEINAMGLDTFLKDKKNITAAEVQDFIANNKIQLGEARYQDKPSMYQFARQQGMSEDDAASVVIKAREGDPEARRIIEAYANINITKYPQYALPGGENYREVVITLPSSIDTSGYKITGSGNSWFLRDANNEVLEAFGSKAQAEETLKRRAASKQPDVYKSTHWDDPNALAHLRMSDRVTDGKKTLLVDEVQSDWHQAGREKGYKDPNIDARLAESTKEFSQNADQIRDINSRMAALTDSDLDEFNRLADQRQKLYDRQGFLTDEGNALIDKRNDGVPDAPFKEDWYQLALKRAIKEAIDNGYDRVALPTGARVNERFKLSNHIDNVVYGEKGKLMFFKGNDLVKAVDNTVPESELATYIGKDAAKKLLSAEPNKYGTRSLSGIDLEVGGEGNIKYYDEVYPNYLKKFGKKYGASVGKTTVDADGVAEPLHYMEITPAMREAFKTGIHMKRGGKVSFANDIDAMRLALSKG